MGKAQKHIELLQTEIGNANVPNEVFLDKLLHFSPNPFHVEVQYLPCFRRSAGPILNVEGPVNLPYKIIRSDKRIDKATTASLSSDKHKIKRKLHIKI